ncbi:unnamed protein product (macronuclear) [Paramecium tetraurelia]|uniref:HTH psq-type domain-containing protein n=1 Tax=Paramecium tetraurelia TaxID=5888 RepID=A0CAP7_PARTE|nr:uncharacterized protein GSPATT00036645001 [Paramecium tetraurelia]CAK67864.1 unnamed protein product [Paramecium tetraurelia]|eukprot:XP_001435261.1 hypothetical protein (macronuclear) [Paramecium tetraurelia strain d4-2]
MKQGSKKPKTSYHKLSSDIKQTLIHLICRKGFKIKHAASQLNIKYSAAKSIFLYHRNNMIKNSQGIDSTKRCLYRTITKESVSFRVVTKIAGEFVNSKTLHPKPTQTSI